MPKIFCQNCGGGTDYSNTRPKFCCHCTSAFGTVVGPVKKPKVKVVRYEEDEEDEGYETEGSLVIRNPLDYVEIQGIGKKSGMTFDEIVASGPPMADLPKMNVSPEQGALELKRLQDSMTASKRNGRIQVIDVDTNV